MTRPYEEKSHAQLIKSLRDVRYTDSPAMTIPILAEALARLLEDRYPPIAVQNWQRAGSGEGLSYLTNLHLSN